MVFKPTHDKEGSGAGRVLSIMRTVGYNPGGKLDIAEVTSEYPEFRIRLLGDIGEIPDEGLICNPDLFQHTETVKFDGRTSTIEYPNKLVKGAKVFVFDPEHGQLVYVLTMAE
ncbi:hypothetical protein JOC25_000025 [Solibacillus kalamii]|uniref:Uncharacterized protein n=1 Tax=Solibacillus kalamii TaxID=1748298 RepID=A0ABX3ZHG4_9BACL|nr:hypothetical protein [Solibacillus kalamii]MBM7663569.1 hypothetical protein [Solibacillus kalamii]OUZ39169.1 hypothetical protein CBM15_09930 [Solibacillus kalamii]